MMGWKTEDISLPVQLSSGKLDDAKSLCCISVGLSNQEIQYEIGDKIEEIIKWYQFSVR